MGNPLSTFSPLPRQLILPYPYNLGLEVQSPGCTFGLGLSLFSDSKQVSEPPSALVAPEIWIFFLSYVQGSKRTLNLRGEQYEGNPEPCPMAYGERVSAHLPVPRTSSPAAQPKTGCQFMASLCVRSGPASLLSPQRGEETIPRLGTLLRLCLSWAQSCRPLPLQLRIRRSGLYAESGTCDPGTEWEALPQAKTVCEFQQQVSQEDP